MSQGPATITSGIDFPNDDSITRQDLTDAIENMEIGDLTRAHAASSSSFPMVGTSAPTAPPAFHKGEVWIDTLDPIDGASTDKIHTTKTHNGTVFRPPVSWTVGPTAPTFTAAEGMMWWDSALDILRIYASHDGILGWHPITPGYQLWINRDSAASVPAGAVLSRYTAGSGLRQFKTSSDEKDGSVIGVAMEVITKNLSGVIALVSSGAVVQIKCDAANPIVMGDGITGINGIGETCDLMPSFSNAFSTKAIIGQGAQGCFAEALEAKASGTGLVYCRLLGYICAGIRRIRAAQVLAYEADSSTSMANANWDGATWHAIDVTAPPNGADFTDSIKHTPIVGVFLTVTAAVDCNPVNELTLKIDFSKDGGTTIHETIYGEPEVAVANGKMSIYGNLFVPTALSGTPTAAGNSFYWRGTKTGSGTPFVRTSSIRATSYLY